MDTTRRALLAAGPALLLAPGLAHAALAPADQALVDKATAYLQGLQSARGKFVQTDARGSQTTGQLYLQRPGKARFEYEAPSSLLVVSDGRVVSVADKRLKTVNRYFLSQTPLKLFLADEIRLDRGVHIAGVKRLNDGFEITAQDRAGKTKGQIIMTFADSPMQLLGWTVTDARNAPTRVRLTSLVRASGLDPDLFKAPFPTPPRGR
ncbi:MAG TPA: outer-membrane lipoprotein carrier protein LolA [Caulobacter sp.]|nr:outer-membrane lipoprotein carrier protein LolA [Caulobacter sp.]